MLLFLMVVQINSFEGGPLVMDEHDVLKVANTLPLAQIVVVHMEAVNHWHLSRKDLHAF